MTIQILQTVSRENIVIFGKQINEDVRNAGYNIGDLLNMPYLANAWNANPHHDEQALQRMYIIGTHYKGSIVSNYIENRPPLEIVPNIPRVIEATKKYTEEIAIHKTPELFESVQEETTLCIHVRCGDKTVDPVYIGLIENLSRDYKKVYLFGGIHLDEYYKSNEEKTAIFIETMNAILSKNNNIYLVLCEPDMHISLMSKARHLLLHHGGFSVVGSIVCKHGQLHATPLFNTMFYENWQKYVNAPIVFHEV